MTKFISEEEKKNFPRDFLWGASTAAHQVEGNQVNDWTEWEAKNVARLVKHAEGSFYANPDTRTEALLSEIYLSNAGKVDHWSRYPEDLQLAKDLGLNAYRFSVEWSRIQPAADQIDYAALAHYREMILKMHELGLTPMLTLWHFTLPLWVRDLGGWESLKIVDLFVKFTEIVVAELGDVVDYWITINEPGVYASQGYIQGEWPPAKRNALAMLRVLEHFALAHNRAYRTIKEALPQAQVSLAHNFCYYEPVSNSWLDLMMTKFYRWWHNDHFMTYIRGNIDFVGVNYYFHEKISGFHHFGNQSKRSDLNWGLSPEGIFGLAKEIYERYKLPIIFTENGLADARNFYRPWYIAEAKQALLRALQAGIEVKGYFHWSLLDNFEWAKGYWPRFGLIAIDPKSGERKVRDLSLNPDLK
jgi:beta-glucosidase